MMTRKELDELVAGFNAAIKIKEVEAQAIYNQQKQVVQDNAALVCPVTLGQEIMFNPLPDKPENWGKVLVEGYYCQQYPDIWQVNVKLLDIPSDRAVQGQVITIRIVRDGTDWRPVTVVAEKPAPKSGRKKRAK